METVEPAARGEQAANRVVDVGHRLHLKEHLKRLMHIRQGGLAHTAIERRAIEHALDRNAAFLVQHGFNRLFKAFDKSGKIQLLHQYSSIIGSVLQALCAHVVSLKFEQQLVIRIPVIIHAALCDHLHQPLG